MPSAGGAAEAAGAGGADDYAPPDPVDPAVSRAWTWEECGRLEPAPPDREALFDADGQVVVLGQNDLRVYDAAGALESTLAAPAADSLVTGADGAVLLGKTRTDGIWFTPVGDTAARLVLPLAPVTGCGAHFAFSSDGAFVYTTDGERACAWRAADSTFAGSAPNPRRQITFQGTTFVSVEPNEESFAEVRYDLAGNQVSKLNLPISGTVALSPAGDRAVVGTNLVDLATGKLIPLTAADVTLPVFSQRGEVVLVGDGVFRSSDGTRLHTVSDEGALRYFLQLPVLSADGQHALSLERTRGRATLLKVEEEGVAAVLGPPPLPVEPYRQAGISDLAISHDGSLLAYSLAAFASFAIRVAPNFADSRVAWAASVSLDLSVDVSRDGRFVALGGDGRAIYTSSGAVVWQAEPPPPGVEVEDNCILDRLRFSPKANWIASSNYDHQLQLFEFDGGKATMPWSADAALPAACNAAAFSRNELLLATSAAALYRRNTGEKSWTEVWSAPLTSATAQFSPRDVEFSPDETQLLVSRCESLTNCKTTLLSAATGEVLRDVPELAAPHPSFSPEGSWIVAGNKLLHLPSGELRKLDANVDTDGRSPALFTSNGDIITGSQSGTLTRYCRSR